MLHTIINYTEIEERDGALFLFDPRRFNLLCHEMEELEKVYHQIRDMLSDNDYPTSKEWIFAVADKGADGLHDAIVKDTETEARRLKVPCRIAEQWKRTAIQEAPREIWGESDSLRMKVVSLSGSLPRLSYGYNDTDGVFIDSLSMKEKIKSSCSSAVTDEMKTDADTIIALADKVRELELKGINARELIGKYIQRNDTPGKLDIYRDIAIRRHAPGYLTPTDLAPFTAIKPINL